MDWWFVVVLVLLVVLSVGLGFVLGRLSREDADITWYKKWREVDYNNRILSEESCLKDQSINELQQREVTLRRQVNLLEELHWPEETPLADEDDTVPECEKCGSKGENCFPSSCPLQAEEVSSEGKGDTIENCPAEEAPVKFDGVLVTLNATGGGRVEKGELVWSIGKVSEVGKWQLIRVPGGKLVLTNTKVEGVSK